MVVSDAIHNIMGGMESTAGVRLHNHRRKLKQRFDIIKKLGQGTYGKVQLGINKETGQEVAIKTIKKSKIETDADLVRIRREIQIMSSVQHPNIIHIYEVFENREKMVLVMEYAAGGELYDYLSERKVLDETEARRIFRQISTAVYYCHKHKICHRDLKLENILLDEHGSAKIADFGLSNVFDEQRLLGTFCGSPLYASPEIVKGTPYHGPEVDCWSLGVLLYTLVYGAMPFDGSNFKRLVKQISQGDYFEPKKPSPASSLIRDMLNVNPACRANIEKICAHDWVNESQAQSCVEIAEELANQTPVRLDLLLSLAPPPASGDALLVAKDQDSAGPARSQSVGSLIELDHPRTFDAEKRRLSEAGQVPKRKLEQGPSTEEANQSGAKRKERSRHRDREHSSERRHHRSSSRSKHSSKKVPVEEPGSVPLVEEPGTVPLVEEPSGVPLAEEPSSVPLPEEPTPLVEEPSCIPLPEEPTPLLEEPSRIPLPEEPKIVEVKENVAEQMDVDLEVKKVVEDEEVTTEEGKKVKVKRKKKTDSEPKPEDEVEVAATKEDAAEVQKVARKVGAVRKKSDLKVAAPEDPARPVVRRRSKVFESEIQKFNNMSATEVKAPDKPKKVFIPGVKVSDFKKAYERKSLVDLTAAVPPADVEPRDTVSAVGVAQTPGGKDDPAVVARQAIKDGGEIQATKDKDEAKPAVMKEGAEMEAVKDDSAPNKQQAVKEEVEPGVAKDNAGAEAAKKQKAVAIIGNAIAKPPKPTLDKLKLRGTGALKKSAAPGEEEANIALNAQDKERPPEGNKSSKVEIVLKSATLPRRKTSKAEIQLGMPKVEYRTEVEHMVGAVPGNRLQNQRSEVAFPVAAAVQPHRSVSVESESAVKPPKQPKERIIPIQFERPAQESPSVSSPPPSKPPVGPQLQHQRSLSQQRSGSLSRQSTLDSDTESTGTVSGAPEPIRKSPREYIIPIAVEGGGYVTPRAGSLEPDSAPDAGSAHKPRKPHRFPRTMRMGSLLSDGGLSEDDSFNSISSPFGTLNRHREGEPDDDKSFHHMHRLRSSRPACRPTVDRADSVSSAEEEEDDDDGFELLTAESLFSTLLSRVRNLTQRLNVDDNRTAFPSSRFMNHNFPSHSPFWGNMEPSSRRVSETSRPSRDDSVSSWRRSLSRDTDCDSQYSDAPSSLPRANVVTVTVHVPRLSAASRDN